MKKYAPLLTLLSVVLLGVGLVVANMFSTPQRAAPGPTVSAAPVAEAGPAAPAAADPGPVASAAGGSAPPAAEAAEPAVVEKAYTGRSAGNEVTVAVAVKDGKAAAYVCNGKKIEAWLEGTLTDDRLTLTGRTGSLTATVTDKATLGSVTVDGAEWPFAAEGVASPAGITTGRATLADVAARVGWTVEGTR